MKDIKRTIPMYSFYDRTGIQDYLEAQAAQGWMIEKIGTVFWHFRRMEPKKVRFSVVYFPEADLYDPMPGEEEQTFREYCEHGGWCFAASQAQMLVFYSGSENPTPIDTDPAIEVENIHKSMKKNLLPSYWVLTVCAVLQMVTQCLRFSSDFLSFLSESINLYFIVFWPSMLLVCVLRLILYYRWLRWAKRAAAEGEFLGTRSLHHKIEQGWAFAAMAGLMACPLIGRSTMTTVLVIFGIVVGIGLVAAESAIREGLKKKGYDAAQNKVGSLILVLVVLALLCAFGVPLVYNIVDIFLPLDDREPPLELSAFMDVEYKSDVAQDSETVLLGRQIVWQNSARAGGPITGLNYQVLEIKADFLYEPCLEEVMSDTRYERAEMDSAPWGAEQAWVYLDGEETEGYLLCYEDKIVTIWPTWEMTGEQMGIVREIFQ